MKYCESIYQTIRRKSCEVMVGGVGIGAHNPIRIQSMTTTNTRDIEATGVQIIQLAEAGCEIARVTVQGKKEAESCEGIKNFLETRGCKIPLVADIHFYPPAALMVADFVDKVRINPGNFVDPRATFKKLTYDDASYQKELDQLEEAVTPLVEKCKRLKKAIRIGTNHGSLSDRIMNRYGDTPKGMVESALEFAQVFRKLGFHNFLFSMKASHPVVMIHAYRLLVQKMDELGFNYPLHLGVTEAGEGMDGRIKSAIGIGSLLADGLGDTIRVSLTEDPCDEMDPAKRLVRYFETREGKGTLPFEEVGRNPFFFPEKKKKIEKPFHPEASVFLWNHEGGDGIWSKEAPINQLAHFFEPKESPIHEIRKFVEECKDEKPVIFVKRYECSEADFLIEAGIEVGSLLADSLIDGICLDGPYSPSFLKKASFALLQGARKRSTRTEFISCPGCGRTLFNLQKVSARIREKTGHIPGLKIAIMGCIVNGPGEMADADFGYVGSKTGKVDLYIGKTCVVKDIDEKDADDRLIELIKLNGKWHERPEREV